MGREGGNSASSCPRPALLTLVLSQDPESFQHLRSRAPPVIPTKIALLLWTIYMMRMRMEQTRDGLTSTGHERGTESCRQSSGQMQL
ncbi:hypothetical protein Naga_100005g41 [Nannochloropsis gaditana]|uniref:Uncharacterized protein n=1 Tax=Nannochloropsis gaditana TaxID=72520 RepID=W7TPB6_9STRA|nr:hypothetical protein Naga_100005g41 [Nannochloropsis gaditana]